MPYKEKEIVKRYFTIAEVAKILNVNTSLLRFWENEFKVKVKRSKKGIKIRLYTQAVLDQFSTIYDLVKVKRFTHEGARQQLDEK
jgi:DNA-binding transcriptional MerR regulator